MKRSREKILLSVLAILLLLIVLLSLLVRFTTFHPAAVQPQPVTGAEGAPLLRAGDSLKVLCFNVQYMAGKHYFFWYDSPAGQGDDTRPSPAHISETLQAVARIIIDEDPDVVILQEMNENDQRTDREDQLARLLALLPEAYRCHTSAFYWKADFVPHPRIWGPAGMKLSTISKYQISEATRYQLPLFPKDVFTRQFYFKRAVLAARLPVQGGKDVYVLNTHLDAFAKGNDIMTRQVEKVDEILSALDREGYPWVIGGDFNIMPPGLNPERLPDYQKPYYRELTELALLYDRYSAIPAREELQGPNFREWYTHNANNPQVTAPDKTIDYFFYSRNLQRLNAYVRQHDTLEISDHLPLIAVFKLPEATAAP
ncbi:MAG: endonuclease/exonuclease/phosphatase family protein [Calditrichaeota bacterium]|nr:endonuclease/exonuclease/phosphatase family protein [Calditrichota bacterium]MCB0291077.1 endonuclease/exonuclease/phosphatase family protein [Calditrichota bacterium]MCB0294572.1 endonuclease/exonuclease/phosphatase family protein [Calditrichota bacterium]MCB0313416.1 endonuclease/exonuclease/phosphatase family protein [Calditrichota bacterium]MCB9089185.1 endonuclease/exonuclease/phosphatase family protein [Calditrichia bacterium]